MDRDCEMRMRQLNPVDIDAHVLPPLCITLMDRGH